MYKKVVYKSKEEAVEALKKMSSPTCVVRRDGKLLELKAEELVVGDIVILDGHDMEGYYSKEYLVKRIVGLPGETVKIEDGNVYIKPADSSEFYLLQENYLPEGTKTTMMDDAMKKGNEIVLGDNEYYCLGDNRPVSNDSRNLGPFTADRIKGVAIIRVFPLNEVKIL